MSWRSSSGLRSWLVQRLSAVYIMLFMAAFAIAWVGEPISFQLWRAWVAHSVVNIALLLFVVSLLVHAWVGGRDVVMDYVTSVPARYVLLIGFALGLIIMGLWTLRVLFSVTSL